MLLIKRISITFIVLCVIFSSAVISAEENEAASDDANLVSESTSPFTEENDPIMSDEESLLLERPALPPMLPPASMSPEQVRQYFSKPDEEEYIILNFDNADIKDVLATVSTITGENFILGAKVGGKITIHSSEKIPLSEVLTVFESVLEVNNMALVRSGAFFKIVQSAASRQMPLEVLKGGDPDSIPYGDRPITQLIFLDHVPVRQMTSVVKPMLSKTGLLTPYQNLNLLIVSDLASNVRRLLTIINEVDVDAFESTRMAFIQLKNSDVSTLSRELTNIINALNIGRDGIAIVPIERLNSLVIFSSGPGLLKTAEAWIKKLDDEFTTGQNIFVYHVQNVEAKKIASVLKNVYIKNDARPVASTAEPAPKATKKGSAAAAASRASGTAQVAIESGRVEIDVFDATNSLVILASPGLYKDIKETIKKLDLYPKEVLIEVVIAEVKLDDTDKLGVQWSALHSVSMEGDRDFTGLAQVTSSDPDAANLNPTSLLLGSGSSGFSYILFKPKKLAAMIHALASKTKLNVLSSPRLLVRDKEEASIEVGEDIPTASSTTVGTTTGTTQNIEYKTVGIKLKIRPSINDEKTVVLDIEQEVSDRLSNVDVGGEGFSYPSFSTRNAKTSIVVPDNQGVSIGGMMRERNEKRFQGVPFLSSIPFLGSLFRYTVDVKSKTELIIFLTPHVISSKAEADMVTTEFVDQLKILKETIKDKDIGQDIYNSYSKDEAGN